jgi:hypothetical protein
VQQRTSTLLITPNMWRIFRLAYFRVEQVQHRCSILPTYVG